MSVDKLKDKFGSPTLDELTTIVRAHNAILDERGFPDDVAVEVASPGATRKLRVPGDLKRFASSKSWTSRTRERRKIRTPKRT